MPNTAQHDVSPFESLSEAEMVTATGGFDIGGLTQMASGIAQQAGSPEAAKWIGMAGNIAGQFMGGGGGGGAAA
jgi:hypothetical protein